VSSPCPGSGEAALRTGIEIVRVPIAVAAEREMPASRARPPCKRLRSYQPFLQSYLRLMMHRLGGRSGGGVRVCGD
jgi:hypothetical protein